MVWTMPKGYKRTQYQEFSTFEQGDKFLGDFCCKCAKHDEDYRKTCRINNALRSAMGDNYPMWSPSFVRIEPKDIRSGLETKVVCKLFKPAEPAKKT